MSTKLVGYISPETLRRIQTKQFQHDEIKTHLTATEVIPLLVDDRHPGELEGAYIWGLPMTSENAAGRIKDLMLNLSFRLRLFPDLPYLDGVYDGRGFRAALASLLAAIPKMIDLPEAEKFIHALVKEPEDYDVDLESSDPDFSISGPSERKTPQTPSPEWAGGALHSGQPSVIENDAKLTVAGPPIIDPIDAGAFDDTYPIMPLDIRRHAPITIQVQGFDLGEPPLPDGPSIFEDSGAPDQGPKTPEELAIADAVYCFPNNKPFQWRDLELETWKLLAHTMGRTIAVSTIWEDPKDICVYMFHTPKTRDQDWMLDGELVKVLSGLVELYFNRQIQPRLLPTHVLAKESLRAQLGDVMVFVPKRLEAEHLTYIQATHTIARPV